MTTTTNPDARPARRDGARPWRWGVALLVLLCVPLVVALVYLHHPRWYPLLDWAQTEIRIRDISHGHPPLIGLAGRIGPLGADGGSHPGPLSFYLLWPVWQLLGGAAYGMYVGTVVLDVVAVGLCLWIAQRRGGLPMLVSGALVLAVLMRAYGAYLLTLPWNPYLPVLWWCVVLLAVWSLLCDDLAMLPVAAFAGTFCVQTHISYLGLVGGLGVLAVAVVGVRAIRGGRDRRRAAFRFGLLALGILVVLWIPPVVDEILHHPGNLTTIRDYFSNPPDAPIGMRHGLDVLLTRLNPARLFGAVASTDGFRTLADGVAHGSRWPGALTIAAWLASVAGAWRLRAGRLLRLDAVIGATLVLGAVSSARIFGPVWFYLLLWAIPILALMLATIAWTVVRAVQARDRAPSSTIVRAAYTVGIVGIVVATGIATFWAVDNVAVMSPRMNAQLAALSKPTVAELHRLARAGGRGPVYVSWQPEPQNIGAEGYGLLDELLRHGFDVKADPSLRPGATRAHVLAPDRMATQVHLAIGPDLERWRRDPRFREIASDDPRSPAERAKSDRLRARAVAAVRRDGRTDLLDDLQDNTFVLLLKDDLPDSTQQVIARMLRLGLPAAVFVGPVADPPR